jgi:hypothetical protein
MKHIIYTIILITLITSCKKVFEEDDVNKFTINSASDLSSAVATLNYRFCFTINKGYKLSLESDDRKVKSMAINEFYDPYIYAYSAITISNDIIQKTKKLNTNDIEIQHLLGEVYFIRAYTYFCLARQYGQVPIVDDVDVNYTLKKPSFREIYSFIESDLLKAIGLLPKSASTSRVRAATPITGTAKALLAEVYLTMGGYPLKDASMYVKAATMAAEVIDSAQLYGYGLVPDLADLWNGKHRINEESIFALYSKSYNSSKEITEDNNFRVSQDILGAWVFIPELDARKRFYNTYPESYRKDMTYINDRFYLYNKPCIVDTFDLIKIYCPPPDTIPYHLNYSNESYNQTPYRKNLARFYPTVSERTDENCNSPSGRLLAESIFKTSGTIYLLRYAHTLLTYAEAKARSGSVDASAYEAVNQVRRRANKVDLFTPSVYDLRPVLNAEQFADSVATERGWEFAGEFEGRWFDLLRLEWTKKLNQLIEPNPGSALPSLINKETFFYPIPKEDQKLNLNFE